MKTLFIQGKVSRIRKRGDLLLIKKGSETDSDTMTCVVSPVGLEHITLAGDQSLSTAAMGLIAQHGGVITLLDERGHPLSQFLPFERNAIIDQYEKQATLSSERRLDLVKMICAGSLVNRGMLLKKIMQRNGFDLYSEINAIKVAMNLIPECQTINSLRGIEGNGAHAYFEGFKKILPDHWGFRGRIKNPSHDPVNALLSYGYGILYGQARIALINQGVSPYHGVLHDTYRKQEALVYDFVEEFRQSIVDRVVLTFINQKGASPDDFTMQEDGTSLIDDKVRKKFVHHVLKRLSSEASGTNETYSRHMEIQAKRLTDAIIGNFHYRPFVYR